MEIETALRHWLRTQPAIRELIGDRVYPLNVPQTETRYLCILTQVIATDRPKDLSAAPMTLAAPNIQLDCCDTDYTRCKTLARLIKGTRAAPSLDRFQGMMGPKDEQHYVQCAAMTDERETPVPLGEGSDRIEYRVTMVFAMWHDEAQ